MVDRLPRAQALSLPAQGLSRRRVAGQRRSTLTRIPSAYHAAVRGETLGEAVAAVAARGGSGAIKDALDRYFASTTFNDDYSDSTKALRRTLLAGFSKPPIGNAPLAQIDREYIERDGSPWPDAEAMPLRSAASISKTDG